MLIVLEFVVNKGYQEKSVVSRVVGELQGFGQFDTHHIVIDPLADAEFLIKLLFLDSNLKYGFANDS